jgi:hypothetical protein
MTDKDWLKSNGFVLLGCWVRPHTRLQRHAGTEEVRRQPGIYAFVVDDIICYIGRAERMLRRRLRGYNRSLALGSELGPELTEELASKLAADAVGLGVVGSRAHPDFDDLTGKPRGEDAEMRSPKRADRPGRQETGTRKRSCIVQSTSSFTLRRYGRTLAHRPRRRRCRPHRSLTRRV